MRLIPTLLVLAVLPALPARAGHKAEVAAARAAIARLQAQADAGSAHAEQVIGNGYLHDDANPLFTQDLPRALALFQAAAAAGDPDATCNVGVMTRRGDAVPADPVKSHELFLKAAREGVCFYNVGDDFAMGTGTAKDLDEAQKWLLMAVEQGDADAARKLAEIADARQDAVGAMKWRLIAARMSGHRSPIPGFWTDPMARLEGEKAPSGAAAQAEDAARSWIEAHAKVDAAWNKARAAEDRRDYASARDSMAQALAAARAAGVTPVPMAGVTYELGRMTAHAGDAEGGARILAQSVTMFETVGGPDGPLVESASLELARLDHDVGHHAEAVPLYERGLSIARRLGQQVDDPIAFAGTLEDAAASMKAVGRADDAARLATEAAALRAAHPGETARETLTDYR